MSCFLFYFLIAAEARSNIVAMSAEWIHNGTLLDFPARLYTVQRLAEWANMLGYNDLPAKLTSLAAHFEQYSSLVEKSCNEQRLECSSFYPFLPLE